MELLDDKSHALLFVGIHGMGGIGKTTLAKTIYNKLSNQFEHRSFIVDIRESWKRGAHDLQSQLIYDISNQKEEVRNKDEGINIISSRFKDKKVLLLLDDVDEVDQVKCLAGNHDWFSLGSRIIITTRNKRILEEVEVDYPYDHKEMDKDQSLILFSKHAFRRDSPPREFKDLTHEVVLIAAGLPLSLEIFGSLLCGKELEQWRETIKKLKKVPNRQVQEKLRISYEALDYRQKQIFLDIACFFIGKEKTIPFYMWDACDFFPGEGIEVLIFMSLIKVGSDHRLRMHDQLRDLGREIVREENQLEPWCRSRLWDYEEVKKVLKGSKGTGKIVGINLSQGNSEGPDSIGRRDGKIYAEKQFKNLTSLRFLHLDGAHLSGDFKDSMEELRWLRWPYCPANFEVNNFCVKELAVLELSKSKINEKWKGWYFFMMAEKLKYLDLSDCECLEDTDFLSAFKKLEVLILKGCRGLKRISSSVGDMKALLRLELSLCTKLKELPAEIGKLKALHRLDLFHCYELKELPAEIGKLKALQQLILFYTSSLSALPDSIGSLENLELLDITCSGIEELPNGIGYLRKLQELRAYHCKNLKGIMVESMCNLSSLRHLTFTQCDKLQSLPDLPSSLTHLSVTCQSRKLPSLYHPAHLKCIRDLSSTQLKSSKCSQPTDIEESESPQSLNTSFRLEYLNVSYCGSIEMLDISQFIYLRTLWVYRCKNLLEIRVLDKSICLESLYIFECHSIKRLDLPKLESLKKLVVEHCDKLAEIQGLDRLEYLEMLDIKDCASIERLDLPKSRRLKELNATHCKNLAEIEGLDRLEYLESLDIDECTLIKRLDLPKSGRLKILKAERCVNLAKIQGLDGLEYLEVLSIARCTSMERLYLPKSGMLKILNTWCCKNLAEIQGLDSLEYLESLNISSCTSIGRLDLPNSGSMKRLDVHLCKKLAELYISWCASIERLLLPKSESLMTLEARDCENLVEIQGLDRLEFLEELNIIGCKSLKTIPELSKTRIYRYYEIADREMTEYEWDYMDARMSNILE